MLRLSKNTNYPCNGVHRETMVGFSAELAAEWTFFQSNFLRVLQKVQVGRSYEEVATSVTTSVTTMCVANCR